MLCCNYSIDFDDSNHTKAWYRNRSKIIKLKRQIEEVNKMYKKIKRKMLVTKSKRFFYKVMGNKHTIGYFKYRLNDLTLYKTKLANELKALENELTNQLE